MTLSESHTVRGSSPPAAITSPRPTSEIRYSSSFNQCDSERCQSVGTQGRQKASDVFANTNFLFATKGAFAEGFPTIEEARIEVEETDFGHPVRTHHGSSKHGSISEFVNCSNSLCYNGGIAIGDILRHMVREQLTEYETRRSCQGYEGSPKGQEVSRLLARFSCQGLDQIRTKRAAISSEPCLAPCSPHKKCVNRRKNSNASTLNRMLVSRNSIKQQALD